MEAAPAQVTKYISALIGGDTGALTALFEWYRPMLHGHALRICGNTPLAKDALQDTYISAHLHVKTLRNPEVFYPWLRKILINNCYQLLRKERFTTLDGHHEWNNLLHHEADAHFEKLADLQRVYDALHRLSDELRACIMLRYFTSFSSYDEIALMLSVPVGTVRSRLFAARQQLERLIRSASDPDDRALRRSREWSEYYHGLWSKVYDDAALRDELFRHLHPMLDIRFTSGKTGKGREIIERELNDDLYYGTRFNVGEIVSSGNISVIEGVNSNSEALPERCAPSTSFVITRKNGQVQSFRIFDSPRDRK